MMLDSVRKKLVYKYLFVGFITVILDYAIVFFFYSIFNVHYMISIFIGFVATNIFQFYVNFYYTFRLDKNDSFYQRALIFVVAVLIGNFIGFFSIVLIKYIVVDLYIAKTISLPILFIYGYFVSKKFIYNKNFNIKWFWL